MRNIISDTLVLKTQRQGDYDKQVVLFGPGAGLVRATVYGSYRGKSRLAGSTEQFLRLKAYLYYNPVRDSWKLSDAEVLDSHRGIMGSLERILAASVGAEIVMKTDAAGGEERLYRLLLEYFHSLDDQSEVDISYFLIQFLWRYLAVSGYLPDLESCPECGRVLGPGESMVFSQDDPPFSCSDCGKGRGERRLSPGVRRYLLHTGELPWDRAVKVHLSSDAAEECRAVLSEYVQNVVEVPIHSLEGGGLAL